MGINFSHCKASWSYSGFSDFRFRLAQEEGINLRNMEGFCENGIRWTQVKTVLKPFLNHSDCEGILRVDEMKQIIRRLKEICEGFPLGDYDRNMGLELCAGMAAAIKARESLRFR